MHLIKKNYAEMRRQRQSSSSVILNKRLFNTYNRIAKKLTGKKLQGKNIDLGCGDKGFSLVCQKEGIESYGFDYPDFDLEKDIIPFGDNSIDFVTMSAVMEHIVNPDYILTEIRRVLKKEGLVFITTPNWQMDFKNFYNNQDHVKPYSPVSIRRILEYSGFSVLFLEPALIEKSWFWWRLPNFMKWRIASCLYRGTKSILAVAQKLNYV